jgi:hypothetical protein
MVSAILFLLPALALIVALLARRYPGERLLVAFSGRRRKRRPRPRPSTARLTRRAPVEVVRGGLLLGRSLAVRPPPASFCLTR